jgi:PAS domain S-box-containing protein
MSAVNIDATEGPARAAVLAMEAAARDAEATAVVGRHRKKGGSSIDVELTSFAISFRGAPATLISVADVTYLRRTEAQTRYLDLLLATVTDAVVASDDKFILTAWNAAAESTYGRRADEVLGQPDALVFRTDFIGVERAEAIKRLVETGRFHGELTHRREDGKRIHIESRAVAFHDSGGARLGYVSVNRDITERRHAEETIRALLDDVITAQEEERRRIARELHDETAQTLTSLLVGLRAVEESPEIEQARQAAGTLRASVAAALDSVKRIARGLRPSILDDLGLEEALERLGVEMTRAHGFVVDLQVTGARLPRLPEAAEVALYRIAQEALTNVARHSRAANVEVILERRPDHVLLIVEDDGVGFDVGGAAPTQGFGLLGMQERASLVGATLQIESAIGRGTTILVRMAAPDARETADREAADHV